MTGWHEGPLAGFDTETTGPDPETARIVTAAVVVRGGNRDPETHTWLINPGTEIPAEATAVHGITTEQAQADGMDPAAAIAKISARLAALMAAGVPVVAYNAPYDFTVLDRDGRRNGVEPFGDEMLGDPRAVVIDPLVLDKHLDPYRKGSRTLAAACQHYRVTLDGAHDASYDALAAMRVAWKIAVTYPAIAALSLTELHDLQVGAKAVQAASFQECLRRQGKPDVIDGSWPFRPFAEAAA